MKPFDHYTPTTLTQALEMLARWGDQAHVIAGGTDLLLKLKTGALVPTAVVNIKRLPELKGIQYDPPTGLRLGALTTLRELNRSPVVQTHYPCLAQAAAWMASEQVRSFATVGGNLCNAAPSADLAPPLMALDAVVCLVGPGGKRHLPLDAFFSGPGRSALQAGELLQEINIPPPVGHTVYLKQAARAYMDIAVVGVAASVQTVNGRCRQARIVLGAVAPIPLRARRAEAALAERPFTPTHIAQAAGIAAEECSPIDDVRSSAWYRRAMVQVLTRRTLEQLQHNPTTIVIT